MTSLGISYTALARWYILARILDRPRIAPGPVAVVIKMQMTQAFIILLLCNTQAPGTMLFFKNY